jgi:hypothetical protein
VTSSDDFWASPITSVFVDKCQHNPHWGCITGPRHCDASQLVLMNEWCITAPRHGDASQLIDQDEWWHHGPRHSDASQLVLMNEWCITGPCRNGGSDALVSKSPDIRKTWAHQSASKCGRE